MESSSTQIRDIDKVYLYCQLSMKTANMILTMQTSLELGGQNTFTICELVFHNNMISK